jgi:hypothetical protein
MEELRRISGAFVLLGHLYFDLLNKNQHMNDNCKFDEEQFHGAKGKSDRIR